MKISQLTVAPEGQLRNTQLTEKQGGKAGSFQNLLKDAISEANKLQNESDTKIKKLITGESQDIHGTVMAVQQADTSFKMMMQVRNKIMEAYREISRSGI